MSLPVTPPSLHQLLTQLSSTRVSELVSLPIQSVRNERYFHWDELRHRPTPAGITHDEWWLITKFARVSQARNLALLSDKQGSPFSYVLAESVLKALRYIDRHAGGADTQIDTAARDNYIFGQLIEESITSSQLEGASTTRRVAEELLRTGRKPVDGSERMIANNFAAMQYIQTLAKTDLTPEMICEIQRIITRGTLENSADEGRFRQDDTINVVDNRDGAVLHQPPLATELAQRMQRLCVFANQSEDDEPYCHPVVRAILLHFMLAYDHPFADGNGRTARALFYWAMVRHGYRLMEYVSISSILRKATGQYKRAYLYTETDDGDVTYFLIHQLETIQSAIYALREYLAIKQNELQQTQQLLTGMNNKLNLRQIALITGALKGRADTYTISSHQRSHGISYATARQDLMDLVTFGLLQEQKNGKAFQYFAPLNLRAVIGQLNSTSN
ncbi:Fic family protein [Sulfuriferula nivalis]|uniref:Transposase n=1 Tax=Sulfuriferula nivalis TaxID=2675298 RepID=A0A809SFB2_9PROT|nr:Fic family protein [Sulfuriferula nivalis]BBP02117.1 transposase [Sulfuriferula nivalis]